MTICCRTATLRDRVERAVCAMPDVHWPPLTRRSGAEGASDGRFTSREHGLKVKATHRGFQVIKSSAPIPSVPVEMAGA